MANKIKAQATACNIGGISFSEIRYYAFGPVYSGSGGKAVTERYTPNTPKAVAKTRHHYRYQAVLGIDADIWESIYDKNFEVPGAEFNVTVTETVTDAISGATQSRTITMNNVSIEEIDMARVEEGAEHQITEITLFLLNKPTKSAWA